MIRTRVNVAIVACVLTMASRAHADRQLWLEAGASARVTRRVELAFAPQVRFDQDVSRFQALLPELSARYRAARWLRVGGSYRLEYERDRAGDLVVRHRVAVDARVREDVGDVRLDYRTMLAEQIRPSSGDSLRTVWRNRVDVAYRGVRPVVPAASAEIFHMLGDLDAFDYDRLRLTASATYGRGDHDLEVFVRMELYADPQDPTSFILGLGHHYQL